MHNELRKSLFWPLHTLGVCLLSLVSMVSLVYADCTVGGVTLKLGGSSEWERTFFSTGFKSFADKLGVQYYLPLGPARGDHFEGVVVETDMRVKKQMCGRPLTPEERENNPSQRDIQDIEQIYNLPVTDLYDPVTGRTNTSGPTKNEYTVRYMINGEPLVTFTGTLKLKANLDNAEVHPHRGTFKTACGEVWTIRVKESEWTLPVLAELSPEAKQVKEKWESTTRKEGKKQTEEEARKLNAFRTKVKVGSKVRVFTGNFQAKGLVTETKKDLVKIQFTEQVIQFQWTNIRPFEQWVQRSNLLPPQGGASLY